MVNQPKNLSLFYKISPRDFYSSCIGTIINLWLVIEPLYKISSTSHFILNLFCAESRNYKISFLVSIMSIFHLNHLFIQYKTPAITKGKGSTQMYKERVGNSPTLLQKPYRILSIKLYHKFFIVATYWKIF